MSGHLVGEGRGVLRAGRGGTGVAHAMDARAQGGGGGDGSKRGRGHAREVRDARGGRTVERGERARGAKDIGEEGGRDWWTSISEGRTLGRAVVSMRRSILDISGLVVVVAQRTGPLLTRCGKGHLDFKPGAGGHKSSRAPQAVRASVDATGRSPLLVRATHAERASTARPTAGAALADPGSLVGKSRLGRAPLGPSRTMAAACSGPPCCGRYSPCSLSWRLRVRSPIARRPSSATRAIFSERSVRRVARPRRLPCSLGLPQRKMTAPAPTPTPTPHRRLGGPQLLLGLSGHIRRDRIDVQAQV